MQEPRADDSSRHASDVAAEAGVSSEARPAAALFGLAAVLGVVLASWVVLRGGQVSLEVWLALSGSGALVLGPALLGARWLSTERELLVRLVLCAVIGVGPLMLLGRVIKTATHHRPLGAMTYAVIACLSLVVIWVALERGAAIERTSRRAWVKPAFRVIVGALGLGSLGLAALGLGALGPLVLPVLVDGGLMLAPVLVVLFFNVDSRLTRVPAGLGLGLWGLVVLGGTLAAFTFGAQTLSVSLPLSLLSLLTLP